MTRETHLHHDTFGIVKSFDTYGPIVRSRRSFLKVDRATVLTDSLGNNETGPRDVEPVHCIRAGRVISEMKTRWDS